MVIQLGQKRAASPGTTKKRFYKSLSIALAIGALIYLAFFGVVNLVFGNWTSRELQSVMSKSLDRDVRVGRVHWWLSFDGIVLTADKVLITEEHGKPFLKSRSVDVCVALLPLARKQILVKRIDLNDPEFYAKKITPSWWNFSDLPQRPELQHITHLTMHHGIVHLRDKSVPVEQQTESILRPCDFLVERPFDNNFWLFKCDFAVPHNGYATKVGAYGLAHGPFDKWQNNSYHFRLSAKQVNPSDYISVSDKLSYVKGPITIDMSGSGVPSKQLTGKLFLQTPDFTFSAGRIKLSGFTVQPVAAQQGVTAEKDKEGVTLSCLTNVQNGKLVIPGAPLIPHGFSGDAGINNGTIFVKNMAGKIGNGNFNLTGNFLPGQSIDIKYDGTAIDMQAARKTLTALKIPVPTLMKEPFFGLVKHVAVVLKGSYDHPEVSVVAQPQDVYCQPFGKRKTFEIHGGVLAFGGPRLTMRDVSGNVGRGAYRLNGVVGLAANAPIDLSYSGQNIDVETLKLALQSLKIDTKVFDPAVSGEVAGAIGTVRGTASKPAVSLSLAPRKIFYQPLGSERMIEIVAGRIDIIHSLMHFENVHGLLGGGAFQLAGFSGLAPSTKLDINFRADDLDLSHVKVALKELKVQSPLLAEQLLFGKVRHVRLIVKGSSVRPIIDLACVPGDVMYEPYGASRAVHLKGGTISYKADTLRLSHTHVRTPSSSLVVNLVIDRMSASNSQLASLEADAERLDVADLHQYLAAPRTPPAVRNEYLALLERTDVVPEQGIMHGRLVFKGTAENQFHSGGDIVFDNVSARVHGLPFRSIVGHVSTANNVLSVRGLEAHLGNSKLHFDGKLTDYEDLDHVIWDIHCTGYIWLNNMLATVYGKNTPARVISSKPVTIDAQVGGTGETQDIAFTANVNPEGKFAILGSFGRLQKRAGDPAVISGTVTVTPDLVKVKQAQLRTPNTQIAMHGSVQTPANAEPVLDLQLGMPTYMAISNVLDLIQLNGQQIDDRGATGQVRGQVTVQGHLSNPTFKGNAELADVSIPAYKINHVTGRVQTAGATDGAVDFSTIGFKNILVHDVKADIVECTEPGCTTVDIKNGTAALARGQLLFDGTFDRAHNTVTVQARLRGVDADTALTQLFNAPNEVTGTVNGAMQVRADLSQSNILNGLTGAGELNVLNGKVTRFTALQKGLNALTLIKGGLLNFNLNNLIGTVAPAQTGKYKQMKIDFDLYDSRFVISHMTYNGIDLTMRAHGAINLAKQTAYLTVVGNVPRVNKHGILGPIAPFLSLRGLAQTVEAPEKLATHGHGEAPRTFLFKVNGPLNQSNEISQSIYKSFKWLPNQHGASAHPSLAIDQTDAGAAGAGSQM